MALEPKASSKPDASSVLTELRKKGSAKTEAIYRRHGVTEPCFGVSYADITAFTKKLGRNHGLALALWESGVHDARVLAAKLVDASLIREAELQRWIDIVDNYVIDDAVASVAARSPHAEALASKWTRSSAEWCAAAGWNIVASLAVEGRLPTALAKSALGRIQREIHRSANRVRYSMNNALIAIGGSLPDLRDAALAVAEAIGKVEVDHGQTGCKTPDAVPYIRKMAARGAGARAVSKKAMTSVARQRVSQPSKSPRKRPATGART